MPGPRASFDLRATKAPVTESSTSERRASRKHLHSGKYKYFPKENCEILFWYYHIFSNYMAHKNYYFTIYSYPTFTPFLILALPISTSPKISDLCRCLAARSALCATLSWLVHWWLCQLLLMGGAFMGQGNGKQSHILIIIIPIIKQHPLLFFLALFSQ